MKYDKELYVGSGFYGYDDEDIEHYTEKVVKCKKELKCNSCGKTIIKSEEALRESGFMDGEPVSNYVCLSCIEKWLEESRQVAKTEEDE